jgi:long-chain acyl-CoA synthetase
MFWESLSDGRDERTFIVDDGRRFAYNEIFGLGDDLFSELPREIVLILCDRSHEVVAAYLGALRNGLVPMLVDRAATQQSLARAIDAYCPKYIFAPVDMTLAGYAPGKSLGSRALFEARMHSARPINNKLALLIPTSGSTGDPKCVRLTAGNIEACTQAITTYLAMSMERVSICLLPFHHSYGLSVLHNAVFSRSSIVLTEKSVLDRNFWTLMEDEKVTDFSGVPFIFEMMRRMKISDACLQNLQCVTQAGGRLIPQLTKHFSEYFTSNDVKYFTMYGQTEASPRISYVPPERAIEKLGSVGVPIPCGRAVIAETGEPTGEGELLYLGPNVSMGYAFDSADLAKGDEFEGRLYTGDHVTIDEDGFITIVGRKRRFIKLHGISVNLDHAETVLKSLGLDCMVVGEENRLVVCVTDHAVEEVRAAVRDNFSFHPSTVKVVTCDVLPRSTSGKPDYVALAGQIFEAA